MRITQKDLELLVNDINKLTKSPTQPYDKGQTNIGNYHLEYAYGGVKLVRITNEHGGIRDISHDGYGTKKELYSFLIGFINGLKQN